MKIGRNDPCPCGSKKKYKQCCLAKDLKAKGPLNTRTKLLQGSVSNPAKLGTKGAEPAAKPRPLKAVWVNQPVKPVETVNLIERAFGDSVTTPSEPFQPETPLEEPTVKTDDAEN